MALKPYAIILTAVAVMSSAGAAHAASVVDEFATICLSARTAAEATTKARAAGFVTAPAEVRAKLQGLPDNGEILWRAGEGEMTVFLGAVMKRDIANSASQAVTGEMCLLGSLPAQPDLKAGIERLLNVGPEQTVGRSPAYVYEQTGGGRVRLDASDRTLMGVKAIQGNVRVVGVSEKSGMGGLMLMIPGVTTK